MGAFFAAALLLYMLFWGFFAFDRWTQQEGFRLACATAKELSYDEVYKNPGIYVGKNVRWPIICRNDLCFYKGDPERPVVWTGRTPNLRTGERHALTVIASIAEDLSLEDSKPAPVRLVYKGWEH